MKDTNLERRRYIQRGGIVDTIESEKYFERKIWEEVGKEKFRKRGRDTFPGIERGGFRDRGDI